MLKIENIKLSPGVPMSGLTAEAARLLRVREADVLSLRILRRSVDAREGVSMVYTVEVSVKNEASLLRRCRSQRISRQLRRQKSRE